MSISFLKESMTSFRFKPSISAPKPSPSGPSHKEIQQRHQGIDDERFHLRTPAVAEAEKPPSNKERFIKKGWVIYGILYQCIYCSKHLN